MNSHPHRSGRRAVWAAVGIALAAVAGCGQPSADVRGAVSYRGRPVVYGTISVIGSDQKTYYATINPDGTFVATGVPIGPARVGVYSPDPYPDLPVPPAVKAQIEEARRASGAGNVPKPPKGQWVRLPPKYADPLSSGVTADVAAPSTMIEVRLD